MNDKQIKRAGFGRPTKYNPDIVAKAAEYIDQFEPDSDNPLIGVTPTLAGLILYIDIDYSTLYVWENDEDKQDFSKIVKKLRVKQEQYLLSGGLTGGFNASITKLMLVKHGYRDAQTIDAKIEHNVGDRLQRAIERKPD